MKKIILILIVALICSCVHSTEISEHRTLIIYLNNDDSLYSFKVIEGSINENDQGFYQLHFNPVKGGKGYFLGTIKYHDVNGKNTPRFFISQEGEVIKKYSINEIINFEKARLDDTLTYYKIPLIR